MVKSIKIKTTGLVYTISIELHSKLRGNQRLTVFHVTWFSIKTGNIINTLIRRIIVVLLHRIVTITAIDF